MQSTPPPESYGIVLGIEAAKIFLAAAISIVVSGIWLRHWQYREEFVERRIDDLIDEVEDAADLGCTYWRTPVYATGNLGSLKSVKSAYYRADLSENARPKVDNGEAELMARQLRIAALRSLVTDFFSGTASMELLLKETDFIRALTGGEFGSRTRSYDPTRLREIQISAANYLIELRRARRGRLDVNPIRRLWR